MSNEITTNLYIGEKTYKMLKDVVNDVKLEISLLSANINHNDYKLVYTNQQRDWLARLFFGKTYYNQQAISDIGSFMVIASFHDGLGIVIKRSSHCARLTEMLTMIDALVLLDSVNMVIQVNSYHVRACDAMIKHYKID